MWGGDWEHLYDLRHKIKYSRCHVEQTWNIKRSLTLILRNQIDLKSDVFLIKTTELWSESNEQKHKTQIVLSVWKTFNARDQKKNWTYQSNLKVYGVSQVLYIKYTIFQTLTRTFFLKCTFPFWFYLKVNDPVTKKMTWFQKLFFFSLS